MSFLIEREYRRAPMASDHGDRSGIARALLKGARPTEPRNLLNVVLMVVLLGHRDVKGLVHVAECQLIRRQYI